MPPPRYGNWSYPASEVIRDPLNLGDELRHRQTSLRHSERRATPPPVIPGRFSPLCPGSSDINLFRYCQGVIDLDA
jgi:hypothetical protein